LFIVLEDGRVREVPNLPPNMRVVLIDYDIEDVEKEELKPSPLDGQPCRVSRF